MKTDDLVTLLGQAPPPQPRFSLLGVAVGFFVFCAMVTYMILGYRPELINLAVQEGFWIKTLLLASLSLIVFLLLREAAVPQTKSIGAYPAWLLGLVFATFMGYEWFSGNGMNAFNTDLAINYITCLGYVTIYSIIGMAILTHVMRYFAPPDLPRVAGLTGLAAASFGGLGYSFHCQVDSPTFILIAYGLPVLGSYFFARRFLARALNW